MKRIKSPVTTFLAVLITAAIIILVYIGKATLTEASGFLVIAAGLLVSNDKKFIENFSPTKKEEDQDAEGS